MFAFIVNGWRALEAAILREAKEAERSADLRRAYNDHVEQSLAAMGVATAPPAITDGGKKRK